MNRHAYLTTGLVVKTLYSLSKAKVNIYGKENIPYGSIIFAINHFTRIETIFLPYHIYHLTNIPVWSLADYTLFKGALGTYLDNMGAVSTKNPDRDALIVKTLLTGEAVWMIFPEGRMVKNKKIFEKGDFIVSFSGGKHPPHTGVATLAIRTEFYRQRLKKMSEKAPDEAKRLLELFQITNIEPVLKRKTYIVPVNVTYYPIRVKENILSDLAKKLLENPSPRMMEELMAEGTMLFSGVDMDVRFGAPISIQKYINNEIILKDISDTREINFDDPIPSKEKMRELSHNIMQIYMKAIYDMITINHDHLFASILKLMPFRKINEDDFKRRVYYASSQDLKKMGLFTHNSLESNQISILTDDRFNLYKDFLSVAIEKDILRKQGKTLIKNTDKFYAPYGFHRMRIENPIAVIANEIEPLSSLQNLLRLSAFLPSFWLKRKIVKNLVAKTGLEFEKDYQKFYIKDESKPKNVGMPYFIRGSSKDFGVILIHGYMAAPLEVKELAKYLGRQGIWVYAPRLKGHGTSPDDLARVSYSDWIESVDEGYAIMSNICKKVGVGGFSMGGGLALDLASRVKDVACVFAVSPPFKLQERLAKFVPAVDVWNKFMNIINIDSVKKKKREFIENHPENPHINYFRNPISGIREMERLMNIVEDKSENITAPALIIQSHSDPVVDPRGSKKIFKLLASQNKEYILVNIKRHGILLGKESNRVHRAIADFIKNAIKGE